MTAQVHERLIFNGQQTSMAFCPPIPEGHPRISKRKKAVLNTACWRGYQGTWEIKDGRFYLVALRGEYGLRKGAPLLADWFSGILRVPKGRILQSVHMGFGTVFEEELHIKIEKGRVIATRVIDNRGKEHDKWAIGSRNLPGDENRFPGDDEPWPSTEQHPDHAIEPPNGTSGEVRGQSQVNASNPTPTGRVVLIDTTTELQLVDPWERKIVELKEKPVVFGRGSSWNDVSLPARTIAFQLFEIRWNARQNYHEVELYASHHPFSLNGELLTEGECRPLSVGDVLIIGPFRIEYTELKPLSEKQTET
jgi:hypothetical protein